MAFSVLTAKPAAAGVDPFLGELMLFGGNFCQRGWKDANGQLLAISSNQALFSLYGTTYGGDGRTTFGVPGLRGRTAIHTGQGPGLANYRQGVKGGAENLTVQIANMPAHNHNVQATNATADKNGPGSDFLAITKAVNGMEVDIYHDGPPNKVMDTAMITQTGGGQAISKRSPYQVIRWCVALVGVFPSRN